MGYTLGQAAKAVGMSKTSILRSIKAGRISAGRDELGQWAIEPCELHYPPLTDDTARGNGTEERGVTGVKRLSPKPLRAPPWPKHDYPISNRCWTTSASNGTAGSSRRNGWRHSRSRISGRNAHPRSLSRGGKCSELPPVNYCFYGLWASSVGAFCFQLFVYRFSNPVAGHRQEG